MNQFQEPPQEQEDFPTNVPVPTFRHGNRLLEEAGIDESEHADNVDAFLLYSNDEVRMRTLSSGLVGVGADQESTSTETEGEGSTRKRKTRISFELHPSVFIENLLLASDDFFVSDFDDINDNEDDAVKVEAKAMTEDPQMNALASLASLLLGGNLHSVILVLVVNANKFGVPPQMGVGYFDPCFISVPLTKLPIVSSSVASETLHLVNSQYGIGSPLPSLMISMSENQ
eukprot:scaffold25223_cov153-Skeletonema_marinoi.AAC.1